MHQRYKAITGKSILACALVAPCLAIGVQPAAAQQGAAAHGLLQQKIEAIKSSAERNQKSLHQYTWTETDRITVNGDVKPSKEFSCSYGPDGKVHKVPLGAESAAPAEEGGRFRQRIVAKKTAEMKDYMQQVGQVIALYVPPNPAKLQEAFQQRRVSTGRTEGLTEIIIKDYALPGDTLTIGFDTTAKKIRTLNVHSYLNDAQNPVSLLVEFSSLPDGTNYPLRTTLDAPAKKINVVTTNSNYRK